MMFLVALVYLAFALRRILTYLNVFQQDEYDSLRFVRWIGATRAFDRRASTAILVSGLLPVLFSRNSWSQYASIGLACGFLIILAALEKDPRQHAKKKLVLTERAKRILGIAFAIVALAAIILAAIQMPVIAWVIPIQLIPVSLPLAVFITAPLEKRIQKRFWNEAHGRLLAYKPCIVAITGSYGKTSAKHILGHILETHAPTLMTPGSVNTPMGISRIIREQLTPYHKFFICEMGAYGVGSIKRLCDLAPPDMGMVTAIGLAHYERFKSLDTVARTKFELAESILDRKAGKIIVASDALSLEYTSEFARLHAGTFIRVGHGHDDALEIVEHRQTPRGLEVDIVWQGNRLTLKAPLFGEHHASNLALCFAAASTLGLSSDVILHALLRLPQIAHRLEIKPQNNGSIIVDDAYNSNPVGFANALRILDILQGKNGRRILVTPGMVELGTAHDEEHGKIGRLAAHHVDILIPIQPRRIQALIDHYRQSSANGVIIESQNFAEAQNWIKNNLESGDVVLLENDLPDLFETKLRL